jgi:hypothetical protein
MSDDPEADRIALLIAELDELPFDEREAAIAALAPEDRDAVWAAELDQFDEVLPEDDEELGGGD